MITKPKALTLFILLIISFLVNINAIKAQVSIDSIKKIIQNEVAGKRCKSIIVGIVNMKGKQVFAEGVKSDADPSLPDGNTIYEIGSITKVFTSLVLSKMSLRHELNLNDPISKYLPTDVKSPSKNGKEISLLNLSTHRSGMPRFPYNVDPKNLDQAYQDYTVKELYQYLSTFKPPYEIDSRWRYSNVGYGILGNILSVIEKKDFETLIKDEITIPLRLNNTLITLSKKQKANLAIGHAETGTPVGLTELGAIAPGGALRSSVDDLLEFAAANLALKQTDLLPAMELTHKLQAKKDGDNTYTTMGWTLVDSTGNVLFKDGGMPGYTTFIGIDKKNKIGVVVLSNSNNTVTDIGRYILEPGRKINTYQYSWSLLDTLRSTYKNKGIDATLSLYEKLKANKDSKLIFNENQLNYLGNELRTNKKIKEAITIYQFNLKEYPNSLLALESLGETYRRSGELQNARSCFEKALSLEPQNEHWTFILGKLNSKKINKNI
ncbi:serine hydrolase [Pedobacter sp.]|uniref:serine hydrolase n=1 Tax=Pedobacter sp. TaxID=1411316 RepID=UPI002D7F717D|nr:serine hydrolase [Pedobacter sp.]